MKDFAISIGDRNEVLILNEYNGTLSIISGYEGSDGNNYFNMVFPRDNKTKEPRERAIPQKVKLGDLGQAYSIITQFQEHLKKYAGGKADPAPKPKPGVEDDLPF